MSLRRQLLLVSLLLIALPWAGCQYVREMEGALQSGQEQALLATTQAVATVLPPQEGTSSGGFLSIISQLSGDIALHSHLSELRLQHNVELFQV